MPDLWAMTTTFESVSVGDRLPVLVKFETKETIARLNALAESGSASIHAADGDAADNLEVDDAIFLSEGALRAYAYELLEKGFPIASRDAPGNSLELEFSAPVREGDIISLTGVVSSKREDGGLRLVECQLAVEDDKGESVGQGSAVVAL